MSTKKIAKIVFQRRGSSETPRFWHEVANYKDASSGVNLFKMYTTLQLVISRSYAKVERLSSTMNVFD